MLGSRFSAVLLFALLAACNFRGCEGQTFTLVYKGPATIKVQGPVMKEDVPLGHVEIAKPEGEWQRLFIRVRDVSAVHKDDYYVPYQDLQGRMGLQIKHRGGQSISAGDTIYYPPLEMPGISTAPTETKRLSAEEVPKHFDTLAAELEPLKGADSAVPVIGFMQDTSQRRSVRRSLSLVSQLSNLPPQLKTQVDALIGVSLQPGDDVQVLNETQRRLPVIRQELVAAAANAHKRGDEAAARDALEAVKHIVVLEGRMRSLKERAVMNPSPAELAAARMQQK